jgi:hypothetical protein
LCSAAASGVLTLGALLTAAPASAITATTCFQAQQTYATAQNTLAVKTQADRVEDSTVSGAVDSVADQADIDKAAAASAVAVALQDMNALCGTNGGTGTGLPHPRPVLLNCDQLAARGLHDIPAGNPFYRTSLDINRDGIACETTIPVGTFRVVNGQNCKWNGTTWIPVTPAPAPVTIENPCNCTPTPAPAPQTGQVILQPAPAVAPAPAPVYVPPAQVFVNPTPPSVGATSTGDGTMAGRN